MPFTSSKPSEGDNSYLKLNPYYDAAMKATSSLNTNNGSFLPNIKGNHHENKEAINAA